MANITKTDAQSLLSLQSVASAAVIIGSALDVSTALAATIMVHFGRRADTALSASCFIRLEANFKASGDGFWVPLCVFQSQIAAVTHQAASGTVAASQAVVAMTTTTGMSADPLSSQGHMVYIDNGTIANSEFHRVKLVTASTSITLEENLNNAQTSSNVFPGAEMYLAQVDLTAIKHLRIVVNNSQTGQAVAVEAFAITGDSIG
jgi:hypothetical protein